MAQALRGNLSDLRAGAGGPAKRRLDQFIDQLAGKRKVYHQEPVLFHYPGLPEIEFIDREDLPFMAEFEARTPQIQAELAGVLDDDADELAPYIKPLQQALGDLQQATMWFMQNALGNPDNAGAGSTDYMHLFGLVALGYMWCLIAQAAKTKATNGNGAGDVAAAKLATGRFFAERLLPASSTHLARIKAGAASTMALPIEAF